MTIENEQLRRYLDKPSPSLESCNKPASPAGYQTGENIGVVIEFEANEPHINIMNHNGDVHVIPVSVVKKLIDGSFSFSDIDQGDLIARKIVDEWLEYVTGQQSEV